MDHYEVPDPALRAYDHGVGTLSVNGELRGYLASVVGEIKFPGRSPWPWFVTVWLDGTKERSQEDYGPGWYIVRELDAGYFDDYEPSIPDGASRLVRQDHQVPEAGHAVPLRVRLASGRRGR